MSSLSSEAATKVAAASGSSGSECLKEISDISNNYHLQNGEDTSSQKQKKKRSRRRGRGGRPKEKNSCGSESVAAAAVDKTSSCINENKNDVSSYAHPPRDVKPTMAENGGATPLEKQQGKRRIRIGRDRNKTGEQGSRESSAVGAADKDRKVVPAIKNMSSKSDASDIADSNGPITIRISNPDFGKDLRLRVKKTAKMKKYFASYVTSKSIPSHARLRFTIDGKDIQPDDTPEMLGLKENDVIKCSDSVDDLIKKAKKLGFSPNVDIPHHRFNCGVHPFTSSNTNNADNAKCCPKCFCLVCDEYAYKCKEWDSNTSNPSVGPHCAT